MIRRSYDKLCVKEYESREEMGTQAACEAASCLRQLLGEKDEVNCIFAAAPSQNEFLSALIKEPGIDWFRVNAFHMDEYCGISQCGEGSFSRFLTESIFDRLPFKTVNIINGANEPEAECLHYGKLLSDYPADLVFMGIGENGHIAFNDPPVADFYDSMLIKRVKLDEACRKQQVNDGCFPSIHEVPTHALTVTVPGLMRASYLYCIVPGIRKAKAVQDTLTGPVAASCPASILRKQNHAYLYLDKDSASML